MTPLYNISIDIPTGDVSPAPWMIDATQWIPMPDITIKEINIYYDDDSRRIDVASFVSIEHAKEVAKEKRLEIIEVINRNNT